MRRGYVHDIDPIIATVGGVHLWWYGFVYVLGFLFVHVWLLRSRRRTGLGVGAVYSLSLLFVIGVLLGGRLVESSSTSGSTTPPTPPGSRPTGSAG